MAEFLLAFVITMCPWTQQSHSLWERPLCLDLLVHFGNSNLLALLLSASQALDLTAPAFKGRLRISSQFRELLHCLPLSWGLCSQVLQGATFPPLCGSVVSVASFLLLLLLFRFVFNEKKWHLEHPWSCLVGLLQWDLLKFWAQMQDFKLCEVCVRPFPIEPAWFAASKMPPSPAKFGVYSPTVSESHKHKTRSAFPLPSLSNK